MNGLRRSNRLDDFNCLMVDHLYMRHRMPRFPRPWQPSCPNLLFSSCPIGKREPFSPVARHASDNSKFYMKLLGPFNIYNSNSVTYDKLIARASLSTSRSLKVER